VETCLKLFQNNIRGLLQLLNICDISNIAEMILISEIFQRLK